LILHDRARKDAILRLTSEKQSPAVIRWTDHLVKTSL